MPLSPENSTMIPKAGKNSHEFFRIKLGIFITGLSVFAQLYLFQPLLPVLTRHYHITAEHSSLAVSAGTMGMGAGLLLFAFLADRISRKKLMVSSILMASMLTMLSPLAPDFNILILINFLKGMALSGVTAVALAYLSEEVSIGVLGTAIALYLSGNTIGGMSGRVVSLLITSYKGWHFAVFSMGLLCFVLGLLFAKIFPNSQHFEPKKGSFNAKIVLMRTFLKDRYLQGVFFIGFSVMGSFVAVYNYLGFRLEAPPFSFPHSIIAAVFLMYTIGVAGSMIAGKWSDRFSSKRIIWGVILVHILGLSLLISTNIYVLVAGLGLVTFSFFAAHTLASRMVSQRAPIGKSMATCMYWLFYYTGSSLVGSLSGKVLSDFGWDGFVEVLIILAIMTLVVALWLRFLRPKNLHLYSKI